MIALPFPELLTLVLLGQGTLLAAILLVMESRQRVANAFLAALLMVFALRLLALLLGSGPRLEQWRMPALLLHNTMFLLGPLVLYYARALVRTVPPLAPRDAVHALPFLLACLWVWIGR